METYCSKVCSCGEDLDAALKAGMDAKAALDTMGAIVKSVNGIGPDGSGNVTIEAMNGGECNIHRIESLDESNLVNLRDLESGHYILYGYFSPYAGSDIAISADNSMVSVIRKTAGSHVICLDPLNAKIVFFEMLVDETEPTGIKYTRTVIPVLELGNVKTVNGVAPDTDGNVSLELLKGDKGDKGDPGEPGAQGEKGDKGDKGDAYVLTSADKAEIAGLVDVPKDVTDEHINSLIDAKLGVIENGTY